MNAGWRRPTRHASSGPLVKRIECGVDGVVAVGCTAATLSWNAKPRVRSDKLKVFEFKTLPIERTRGSSSQAIRAPISGRPAPRSRLGGGQHVVPRDLFRPYEVAAGEDRVPVLGGEGPVGVEREDTVPASSDVECQCS
jgi:hypothetical protein